MSQQARKRRRQQRRAVRTIVDWAPARICSYLGAVGHEAFIERVLRLGPEGFAAVADECLKTLTVVQALDTDAARACMMLMSQGRQLIARLSLCFSIQPQCDFFAPERDA